MTAEEIEPARETARHLDTDTDAERRAARLVRFRGPVERWDTEVVERWRAAPPAEHAAAMIELSEYAERMAAQTGRGKDAGDMFPGFPRAR